MQSSAQLKELLHSINRKSYPAYKSLRGAYQFDRYILSIDHVQGDPFASPSHISVKLSHRDTGFPAEYYKDSLTRITLGDFLNRQFEQHQKIRHDRAGLIDEGPAFLAVNGEADNIRGQHVGRELDAAVTQAERAVEGQRSRRFAGAGDVVQQHMTAGDQRHENLFHHVVLADDDFMYFCEDLIYVAVHAFLLYHSL